MPRYNYFNLIVKTLIGIASVLFIYHKIKDHFYFQLDDLSSLRINYFYLFLAFILSFLNWGLETNKWRYAISKIQQIGFFAAFKIVLSSITLSLITPNRIGEIPARAYLLNNNEQLKQSIYATFISSFSQLLVTLLIGLIAVINTFSFIDINVSNITLGFLFILIILLFLIFIFSNKIKMFVFKFFKKDITIEFNTIEIIMMFNYSLLRYLVFSIQYFLILEALDIHFTNLVFLWLIPVCFLLASSIPTFVLSELGVRSSVAILVFGLLTKNELSIVFAASLLWLINIGLPAIYGLFFIKNFNFKN